MDQPDTENLPGESRSLGFEKVIGAALLSVRQGRMPPELLLELVGSKARESFDYCMRRLTDPELDTRDEETLLHLCAQTGMTPRLVESLVALDGDAGGILARRLCRRDPELDLQIARHLRSADDNIVMRTLDLLESVGRSPSLLPLLYTTLGSPSPKVQSKAALLMQKMDTELRYTRQLMAHRDPRVRANALQAIAERADPRGMEFLLHGTSDEDNRVRTLAAVGLTRLGNGLGIRILINMIKDSNPVERRSATWGLGACGIESVKPLLQHLIQSDDDPRVRELAAAALQRITGRSEPIT